MEQARRHEVRVMCFGLAVLAMLATLLVVWSGVSLVTQLRSHVPSGSVSQGAGTP